MKIKSISMVALVITGTLFNPNVYSQNGNVVINCTHRAEHLDGTGNSTGVVHYRDLGIISTPSECGEKVRNDDIRTLNYSHICDVVVTNSGLGSGPYN